MQAFLSARSELAAERDPPDEAIGVLAAKGFPKVKKFTKLPPTATLLSHGGEIFILDFVSAIPATGSDGANATRAVLHVCLLYTSPSPRD